MSDTPQSTTKKDQIVAQWQTVISMQMHFNDMLLRTRAIGSSVVLAAYGAAAISLGQYPTEYLLILGQLIHVSAVIIFVALSLLFSIFIMDVAYYYRLLLNVVDIGRGIENEHSFLVKTSEPLSQKVSRFWATFVVILFYVIPTTIGVLSLRYVLANYPPTIYT